MNGLQVNYVDGFYTFDDQKFHESTKTAFKRTLNKNEQYYYTLKDVILFLENANLSVIEYRKRVVEAKVTAIVEGDKQTLLKYLTGEIDTCPQLDMQMMNSYSTYVNNEKNSIDSLSAKQPPSTKASNQLQQAQPQASQLAEETSKNIEHNTQNKQHQKRKLETSNNQSISESMFDKATIDLDKEKLSKIRRNDYTPITRLNNLNIQNNIKSDFSSVNKLFYEKILNKEQIVHDAKEQIATKPNKSSIPIIIVPNALSSSITISNAKRFFEEGVLERSTELNSNQSKELIIMRKMAGEKLLPYKIIDDPSKFSSDDWDNVVAVFATGQDWQFRKWKYSQPVELFQKVLGLHLIYDDRTPELIIQTWNCKLIKVNQYKQHLNSIASNQFWTFVDDFIRMKKPHLLR